MSHAVSTTTGGYLYQVLAGVNQMSSTDQVNVYGVVTEWGAPKQTKGSDLLCTVKITDPSLANRDEGTIKTQDLLVFAPDRSQLPQVKNPGDIIRLHRSKINHFNERTQLVCSLGGGKYRRGPPASMCLFDSTPTPGSLYEQQPYQRSSSTYHFDEREKVILATLRDFVRSGEWRMSGEADKYRKSIRDIITGSTEVDKVRFNDIIGVVLAVEETADQKVVWMWDGTDTPPFPRTFSTNVQRRLSIQGAEEGAAEAPPVIVLHHRHFPLASLPLSAAAALPMIGTAVPILIRGGVVELPQPGSWTKFRNCGFQIAEGQLQGVFAQKSQWIHWYEDASVLEEYTRRLVEKTISQWYRPDRSIMGSTTPHVDKEVTSLRQIAVDALHPDPQPMSYRCIVHVKSHFPEVAHVDTMCVPARAAWDAAQVDGYTDENQFLFALQLHVVDGSGSEIDVDVFGKDGEEFLKEILPPQDLRKDPTAKGKLLDTLKYLTGTKDGATPADEPVWLDMCIKSYFPTTAAAAATEEMLTEEERKKQQEEKSSNGDDGASGSGSGEDKRTREVRYRLFDTKLLTLAST
jgi:hypothetical protein